MKKNYQIPKSSIIEMHFEEQILGTSGDFGGSGDDIEIESMSEDEEWNEDEEWY